MPETPEIETDNLDEKIHEELEHAGGSLLKAIALSTALFAAFAAVAALRAGSTVNEALVVHSQNSNSNVLMMESPENRRCDDSTDSLCSAAVGRVFV